MTWQNFMISLILLLLIGELGVLYFYVKYNSNFLKQIQSIKGIQFATLEIGTQAPLFRILDEYGRKVILKQLFSEKSTLLLFISSSCPICKSLLPGLKKTILNYDINIVIINSDNSGDDREIKDILKTDFLYARSPQITQTFFVHSVPHGILIDKNGAVVLSSKVNNLNSILNILVNQARVS